MSEVAPLVRSTAYQVEAATATEKARDEILEFINSLSVKEQSTALAGLFLTVKELVGDRIREGDEGSDDTWNALALLHDHAAHALLTHRMRQQLTERSIDK
jgi:hypothetical protein